MGLGDVAIDSSYEGILSLSASSCFDMLLFVEALVGQLGMASTVFFVDCYDRMVRQPGNGGLNKKYSWT